MRTSSHMLDEQGTSDPSRNEDNEDNSRSIYSEISMAAPSGQYEYQKARIINFRIKTKTRDVPTHYNVVVCGDYGVGKTSLIQTFCEYSFPDTDPHLVHWTKKVEVNGRSCSFHLIETWADGITGLGMHQFMGRYRNIDAIDALTLVYSSDSPKSLSCLRDVYNILVKMSDLASSIPVTVFANKSDLPRREQKVCLTEGRAFAKEIGASFASISCLGSSSPSVTPTRMTTASDSSQFLLDQDLLENEENGSMKEEVHPETFLLSPTNSSASLPYDLRERNTDCERVDSENDAAIEENRAHAQLRHQVMSAIREPAEWRIMVQIAIEEETEVKLGEARKRLEQVASVAARRHPSKNNPSDSYARKNTSWKHFWLRKFFEAVGRVKERRKRWWRHKSIHHEDECMQDKIENRKYVNNENIESKRKRGQYETANSIGDIHAAGPGTVKRSRLPDQVPTVDMTWNEWILGR